MNASRLVPLIFLLGCAAKLGTDEPAPSNASSQWRQLLERAVTEDGRVRYGLLQQERSTLEGYMAWIAGHGPIADAYPYSKEDRSIAFMANAYNAAVLYGVLANQPIDSVLDVRIGLFRSPPGAGFFAGQQFRVDEQWVNLYTLEHQYLLSQYEDPLIHVMLNCASVGCPPLRYWKERQLDHQVEQAMTSFLDSPQGIRKEADGAFAITELFFWYADHFEDWSSSDSVCEFLAPYAGQDARTWLLEEHDAGCAPRTLSYDWSLNAAPED